MKRWKCTTAMSVPLAAALCIGMHSTTLADGSRQAPSQPDVQQSLPHSLDRVAGDTSLQRTTYPGADTGEGRFNVQQISAQPSCPITQNLDSTLVPGTGVACQFGDPPAGTSDNGWARAWGPGEVDVIHSVCFGVSFSNAADHTIELNFYSGSPGTPFGDLTLLDSVQFQPGVVEEEHFELALPQPVNVPSGQGVIVEIFSDILDAGQFFFAGFNDLGQTAPTYIRSTGCGIADFTDLAAIGFPNAHLVLSLNDEPPPGACCTGDGPQDCVINTLSECDGLGGQWLGAGSDCANCPQPVECAIDCPDDEDLCPEDLTGPNDEPDGVVDVFDLLAVIGAWGNCPGCPEDITGPNNEPDGVVDVFDLLAVIGAWGNCPDPESGGAARTFCENEPCGERLNDGCAIDPPAWTDIEDGQTVCGTAWTAVVDFVGPLPGSCEGLCGEAFPFDCDPTAAPGEPNACECFCDADCFAFGDCCEDVCEECPEQSDVCEDGVNTRDLDLYRLNLQDDSEVTWEVHAEFPATVQILTLDPACEDTEVVFGTTASSPAGVPFEVSACLPAGEYQLLVTPNTFTGLPCDEQGDWGDAYTASVTAQTVAECTIACCFPDGSCQELTPEQCAAEDNTLLAPLGTECADVTCPIFGSECALAFPIGLGETVHVDPTGFEPHDTLSCNSAALGGQQVAWYAVEGNGNQLLASTCDSNDLNSSVHLAVFCHTCDIPACVGEGSSSQPFACAGGQGSIGQNEVSFCSIEGETYFIAVWETVAGDTPEVALTVTDQGNCTSNPVLCEPTGACCVGQTCVNNVGESECAAQGGFLSAGMFCAEVTCCGNAQAGDCCEPNDTPSCDDADCCAAVCENDPFCCETVWDLFCATGGFDDDCLAGPGQCGAMNQPECDCFIECSNCATCPTGSVQKPGVCGDSPILGCSDGSANFVNVDDGDTVCGFAWADNGTRSVDWYRVTVGQSGTLSLTIESDAPQALFIAEATDFDTCTDVVLLEDFAHSSGCTSDTVTITGLTPGQEVAFLTTMATVDSEGDTVPVFFSFPCASCNGLDWEYTIDVSSPD